MRIPTSQPLTKSAPSQKRVFWGRSLSLRIKLPVIVISLLLLAGAISTIISINATQKALTKTLKNELIAQADSKAELIRSNLIWTRTTAVALAVAAETVNYNEETILATLQNTLNRNEQVFGSTIAYEPYQFQPALYYWAPYYSRTADTGLQFTQLGTPEYDYFKWDWYTLPKESKSPVLSPPYFDKGGGEIWMVTWSAPFFDAAGQFKGVATADIAFSQTQDIVNKITVGQSGYAFLLDSTGTILGIGTNGGKYQTMVDSMTAEAQSSQSKDWLGLVSEMKNGKTGFAEAVDPRGRPMFVAYSPIGLETGWSLGIAYPQTELFKAATDLRNTLINYSIIVVIVFATILFFYTRSFTEPLQQLTSYVSRFSTEQLRQAKGQTVEPIKIQTRDELEDLYRIFNQITSDLSQTFTSFEERLAERTHEIGRRSSLLKAVADVGKAITSFRDLSELLQQATYLIHDNFGYYHIGIFLLDEHKEYAILRATNSEGGRRMLEKKHQLKVGETGIVGYVTQNAKSRIALDVGKDAVYFDNPDLPETRSEMALPLVVGGKILGALDVQSTEPQAFTEEDSATLQILAEQIAVAIQNASLFTENEKALDAARAAYSESSREAWSKILRSQQRVGVIATPGGTIPTISDIPESSINKAYETGDLIIGNDNLTISVPVKVRGRAIGAIRLKKAEIAEAWTQEETNLAVALSDQLSGALESARLYRESQQRGARESIVSDISARINAVSSTDTIMKETVQELGQVLGNTIITFHLLDKGSNGDGTKQAGLNDDTKNNGINVGEPT